MKLLKPAILNDICLLQEYYTPQTVTKTGHPRTHPNAVRIKTAHYPDNVTATDLPPKLDCTLCGLKRPDGSRFQANAHPVHHLRCGSVRIAVGRYLPHRRDF